MKFKNKYKWYKNPIKYWKSRKQVAILNLFAKTDKFKDKFKDIERDVLEMQVDMWKYGIAISKGGKRIDPIEYFKSMDINNK